MQAYVPGSASSPVCGKPISGSKPIAYLSFLSYLDWRPVV